VTIDVVTRSDQIGKRYWQCIKEKLFNHMPRVATVITRLYRSLRGRWDMIKACCSRWSGAMEQVWNSPPSGISIDDYVSVLCILFCISFVIFLGIVFCNCVAKNYIVGTCCNGEVQSHAAPRGGHLHFKIVGS
jgi:hypothetical protein